MNDSLRATVQLRQKICSAIDLLEQPHDYKHPAKVLLVEALALLSQSLPSAGGVASRDEIIEELRRALQTIHDLPEALTCKSVREYAARVLKNAAPQAHYGTGDAAGVAVGRGGYAVAAVSPSSTEMLTEEQFIMALRDLGEKMAADGMPAVKHLLDTGDGGMEQCRFQNWAPHLQREAYEKIGVEPPVRMYRRKA